MRPPRVKHCLSTPGWSRPPSGASALSGAFTWGSSAPQGRRSDRLAHAAPEGPAANRRRPPPPVGFFITLARRTARQHIITPDDSVRVLRRQCDVLGRHDNHPVLVSPPPQVVAVQAGMGAAIAVFTVPPPSAPPPRCLRSVIRAGRSTGMDRDASSSSAISTNRHSALISRIWSIVRACDSSNLGLATMIARPSRARSRH